MCVWVIKDLGMSSRRRSFLQLLFRRGAVGELRGAWFVGLGSWGLVRGAWFVGLGSWGLVRGAWFVGLGSWGLVRGAWFVGLGSWGLVPGAWFVGQLRYTWKLGQLKLTNLHPPPSPPPPPTRRGLLCFSVVKFIRACLFGYPAPPPFPEFLDPALKPVHCSKASGIRLVRYTCIASRSILSNLLCTGRGCFLVTIYWSFLPKRPGGVYIHMHPCLNKQCLQSSSRIGKPFNSHARIACFAEPASCICITLPSFHRGGSKVWVFQVWKFLRTYLFGVSRLSFRA